MFRGCHPKPLRYCVSMDTEVLEPIQLTPMLSLTVALLYMMTADGEIEEHESSQLQAVVGGNDDALDLAMEYVETVPLSQYLLEAPEQLNADDRLCILCNVCDSIMADGVIEPSELHLFKQICEAFEVKPETFDPYFKVIEFKNDKSVLGEYLPENLEAVILPPHLAMAAAIVYMMSVDGHIAKEEIGQLKLMIGEFEGLQMAAMKYVRNFKISQFLKETTPYLSESQKMLILAVIFDTMQSDGKIEEKERSLFETIQKAYGISPDMFKPYEHALTTKNIKPFGVDVVDPKSMHQRRSKRKPHSEGGLFSLGKKKASQDLVDKRHFNESTGEWEDTAVDSHEDNVVHRTLDHNIKDVNESFKNQEDVDLMASNAQIKQRNLIVGESETSANIQALLEEPIKDAIAPLDTDGRMEHLQENIELLHQKLNQVKPTQRWMPLDQALMALKHPNPQTEETLNTNALSDNVQAIESTALGKNLQTVDSTALGKNLQAIESTALGKNLQEIHPDSIQDSTADLPRPAMRLDEILHKRLTPDEATHVPQMSTDLASTEETTTPPALTESQKVETSGGKHPQPILQFLVDEDGGIRLRTLLLVFAISLPMVVMAYGFIYPTMVCQGHAHQMQTFTPDDETSSPKVIEDQRIFERHLVQIRRGEILINNQRFPFYKELNPNNHFATQNKEGFEGNYSSHVVDRVNHEFDYNKAKRELALHTQTEGVRFIDGQSGRVEVVSKFQGQCESHWFN